VLVAEREEETGKSAQEPNAEGFPTQPTDDLPPPKPDRMSARKELPGAPGKQRLVQRPVYFVSTVLRDARERYPKIQNLLLGVLHASRKLRHYFDTSRNMPSGGVAKYRSGALHRCAANMPPPLNDTGGMPCPCPR
jgi:hypothetical protein